MNTIEYTSLDRKLVTMKKKKPKKSKLKSLVLAIGLTFAGQAAAKDYYVPPQPKEAHALQQRLETIGAVYAGFLHVIKTESGYEIEKGQYVLSVPDAVDITKDYNPEAIKLARQHADFNGDGTITETEISKLEKIALKNAARK